MSWIWRSALCSIWPVCRGSEPVDNGARTSSATSAMVKSNSSLPTQSMAGDASALGWARHHRGPDETDVPVWILRLDGFGYLDIAVESGRAGVQDSQVMPAAERGYVGDSAPAGGASTSKLSGTIAAGWASHVGYQYERISRVAWYRAPAPPSKPSYEGGFRKSVRIMWIRLLHGIFSDDWGTPQVGSPKSARPSQGGGLQLQADLAQGGHEGGFPARRRTSREPGGWASSRRARTLAVTPAGSRYAHVGGAHFQFVQQVVPPVTGHDVKQKQASADDARLAAGRGTRQGKDHVGSRHQLGHPVGEAERPDSRRRAGQLSQPPLDRTLTPGYCKHVHASVGQRGDALHQRTEPPAAVDDQHGSPPTGPPAPPWPAPATGRRKKRTAPAAGRSPRARGEGNVGPMPLRLVTSPGTGRCLRDPHPVQRHVGAQHHGAQAWHLGLELGRR